MANPFTQRRLWAAGLIGLIEPVYGMLYLGRGRLALLYLAASIPIALFASAMAGQADALATIAGLLVLMLHVGGGVHALRIALGGIDPAALPWFSRWYALVAFVLAPLLLAFGIRTFLWQPFNIPSAAMEPTLRIGDHLIAAKRAFDGTEPRRGDVVLFRSGSVVYIKRIAGIPGDHVQMRGGILYLNGAPVPRTRTASFEKDGLSVPQYEERLGGHTYRTLDRAPGGPSDDTEVFTVPAGHYFMLGDNRDNSADSRNLMGFIARADIFAKPSVIFWNANERRLKWEPVD